MEKGNKIVWNENIRTLENINKNATLIQAHERRNSKNLQCKFKKNKNQEDHRFKGKNSTNSIIMKPYSSMGFSMAHPNGYGSTYTNFTQHYRIS